MKRKERSHQIVGNDVAVVVVAAAAGIGLAPVADIEAVGAIVENNVAGTVVGVDIGIGIAVEAAVTAADTVAAVAVVAVVDTVVVGIAAVVADIDPVGHHTQVGVVVAVVVGALAVVVASEVPSMLVLVHARPTAVALSVLEHCSMVPTLAHHRSHRRRRLRVSESTNSSVRLGVPLR